MLTPFRPLCLEFYNALNNPPRCGAKHCLGHSEHVLLQQDYDLVVPPEELSSIPLHCVASADVIIITW